jgi:hypothetical protein
VEIDAFEGYHPLFLERESRNQCQDDLRSREVLVS